MTYTPMIQQYLAIKENYQDTFLFFRLGDFYEMFFDDALKAAKELEITLTSRDGGGDDRIPMCGVPYHSARQYISGLVEKGYKIAICEQVEDPKQAKGVVKREVVRLITPGTVMDDQSLSPADNNYIASVTEFDTNTYAFVMVDLTTGEGKIALINRLESLLQEIIASGSRELVVSNKTSEQLVEHVKTKTSLTLSYSDETTVPEGFTSMVKELPQDQLQIAFSHLLNYLQRTQAGAIDHLLAPEVYSIHTFMQMDTNTKRNLELTASQREKKKHGSLIWLLDRTMTAMGARRLKQWIEKPLIDIITIKERQGAVAALVSGFFEREQLREALKHVYDLERLVGRVSYGNVNARELIQLKRSLEQIPQVEATLKTIDNTYLQSLLKKIDRCDDIREMIDKGIMDEPPAVITEGGMIKDGYDEQLDEYRYISRNGKEWIARLQQSEREATGIRSLKVGYNKVFGYYIEVTKPNLKHLPEGRYERKQTLTNAERFITPELKEKEKMIMEAEDKLVGLEHELFQQLRQRIKDEGVRLQTLARLISTIDVLQSFAVISDDQNYTCPTFSSNRTVRLVNSRHPVVEAVMADTTFVKNDVLMDESSELLLITGPNMGGKSTYMRQTALLSVMAQIGCFVPADEAVVPIFDRIFTRIGAADDLVSGQSTFMVEMLEARHAVRHATENSLILLDEIGRGTSTYDGMAIAQSIIEYIHNKVKAKTLFATHYHELTRLADSLSGLKNVHVGAEEEDGHVVFLHKVIDGHADKSYGIHVARLAELPDEVINRAETILKQFEANGDQEKKSIPEKAEERISESGEQLALFGVKETAAASEPRVSTLEKELSREIKSLDLLRMTPMDAINALNQLQQKLRK